MKKLVAILMLVLMASVGCASNKVIDGVEYGTYGLFSPDEDKNPNIKYRLVWGNIIWGVILVETVVAPIYFFGFSIWEPVGKKAKILGQVVR